MLVFLKRHKETLIMGLVGLVVMAALNIMMLQYHYDIWTNPKVGFWSAFYPRFEISGFDPQTYITICQWRPIYDMTRHPLLAVMMWPLSELNGFLMEEFHMNCTIFIVAILWTMMAVASWLLMFRILRKLLALSFASSALLTTWFFSFSHIMLVIFTPDHMSITLPLLLLTIYLAGKAIKRKRPMPYWQSIPLLFVSTGVTTTNMVKVGLADLFTQWGRKPFKHIVLHFLVYLVPLGIIFGAYYYQHVTTEVAEKEHVSSIIRKKAAKDPAFAEQMKKDSINSAKNKASQQVKLSFVSHTEHHIDRMPSIVENIFGEGIILHDEYVLQDANKHHRPYDLPYRHWWYYAMEGVTVGLFVMGLLCGIRKRFMWIPLSMFLFDMLLHVGLEFASADVYIMTAHWAFVMPIAVGYLLSSAHRRSLHVYSAILVVILLLTGFQWWHNLHLIFNYIVH